AQRLSHRHPHSPPSRASLLPLFFYRSGHPRDPPSFPTRRSSDLPDEQFRAEQPAGEGAVLGEPGGPEHPAGRDRAASDQQRPGRSEEHTSELQSLTNLVCRLLLEKKKKNDTRCQQYRLIREAHCE